MSEFIGCCKKYCCFCNKITEHLCYGNVVISHSNRTNNKVNIDNISCEICLNKYIENTAQT